MSDLKGTQKRLIQRAMEAATLEGMRGQYLGKVANATAASLGALCETHQDRADVLLGLLASLAVQTGASLVDLQRAVASSYSQQAEALKRSQAPSIIQPGGH